MDDWIEEDLTLLREGDAEPRVLDQRLLKEPIRRLGRRTPLGLPPSATVADAMRLMRERRMGCVLVVEAGRLVGIVTERDLLLKLIEPDPGRSLATLMTPDPETLSLDDPIAYALNKMSVGGFRHVPLVDADKRPIGIVSVKDVVDYIVDCFPNDVLTVPPDPARGDAWPRDGG